MSSDEKSDESGRTENHPEVKSATPSGNRFGRLHSSSIFFDILSHFRSVIVPGIVAIFSAANGSTWGLMFAGVLIIPTVVGAVIRYISLRYRIENDELVVTEGILFHRVRTVPVGRIQNVDLVQNPLHRLLNVAEARIETASGTKPEAVLRVLPMKHVHTLRESLLKKQSPTAESTPDGETQPATMLGETDAGVEILRIPTAWLCEVGLANNKGAVLGGLIFGAYYQFAPDDLFEWDMLENFDWGQIGWIVPTIMVISGIATLLILLRLLSVGFYVLRFHNYRLTLLEDDLRITCGLFTRISASIPRARIQFISVQQNFWMRWMGLSSIRIETAGGSGKEPADATKSVSGRWFVPVVPDDQVASIVEQLRPGLEWRLDELDWKPLSPQAEKRAMRVAAILSLGVALLSLGAIRPWGFLLGLVVFVPMAYLAIRSSRAMRYARTEEGVVYRSGLLTKKMSMTFFDRIQTVRFAQSPFDRRWKMAELSVDTAAAGPATHTIKIPYLADDFAKSEYMKILARASQA